MSGEDNLNGKDREPEDKTPPFSEEQVTFLHQLLSEREPQPPMAKGKGLKKNAGAEETGKSGEHIGLRAVKL